MKKILIALIFILAFFVGYAQVTNVTDYRIANASTQFGRSLSIGTKVYNIATEEYWVTIAPVSSTATLTSASASFVLLNTGGETQTLSTNGNPGNISISNGNIINLNVNDADASPTNEIQVFDIFQLSGTTLQASLSQDGEATKEVDLSPLVGTDNQTLTFSGEDSLAISNGNTVYLGGLRVDTTGLYHSNRTALDAVSGVNTGDQDLSGYIAYSDTLTTIETKANSAATYQTKLTNPITGTGTTNYLPKFTGASTLGNSLLYDDGGKIGLGTTSPASQFHILSDLGNIKIGTGVFTGKEESTDRGIEFNYGGYKSGIFTELGGQYFSYAINTPQIGERDETKEGGIFRMATSDPYFSVINYSAGGSAFSFDLAIKGNGNMGVGILSPSYKLDVNGDINIASGSNYKVNGTNIFPLDTTSTWINRANWLEFFNGNVPGTGSSTVSEKIIVTQNTHGLAVDDWIRHNGTAYIKAQANTPENAEVIGVVDSVLDANTFRYQFSGLYTKGTYTNGVPYFLSPDVAGVAIASPTYETGEVQVFLGTKTPAGFVIEIDVGVQIEEIISVQELTTTGNSGAATLTGTTLNIPEYTIGGLGGLPLAAMVSDLSGMTTNLNTAFWSSINPTNGDGLDWVQGIQMTYANNPDYRRQLVFRENVLYRDNTTGAFRKVWDSGNDGAGSGLDADLLDGQHGSYYEPAFSKNTAFNKNFGTSAGTVAEGNDSRINNGQTAYGWGDHTGLYLTLSGGTLTGTVTTKKQRLTVLNGSTTGTVTHDSNNGDLGAYRANAANTTVHINNLASGDQGTIYINFHTTTPTSLTVNTYSDNQTTGLTEVQIGASPTLAINKVTSITYTCVYDGTSTYVTLVYGQQP